MRVPSVESNSYSLLLLILDSLDILNNYIQRQRALLEKIKLDITKFEELKSSAERDPLGRLNCIVHDYNQDIYGERVDELVEDVRCDEGEESITDTIDWKLFEGHGEFRILCLHILFMLCRLVLTL